MVNILLWYQSVVQKVVFLQKFSLTAQIPKVFPDFFGIFPDISLTILEFRDISKFPCFCRKTGNPDDNWQHWLSEWIILRLTEKMSRDDIPRRPLWEVRPLPQHPPARRSIGFCPHSFEKKFAWYRKNKLSTPPT